MYIESSYLDNETLMILVQCIRNNTSNVGREMTKLANHRQIASPVSSPGPYGILRAFSCRFRSCGSG